MSTDWPRRLGWSLTLFLLWLLLSQSFHWQSVVTGLVISLVVASLNADLLLSMAGEMHVRARTLPSWVAYFAFLVVDIFKAAWQVAKLAFTANLSLQPGFVHHVPKNKKPMMRVVLANSITLTPGTLTVEADTEGPFVIHVLTQEAADGLREWHIENRLHALERDN